MTQRLTLLLVAFLFASIKLAAQPICGFDHFHQQQLAQNPAYAQALQQSTAAWVQSQQNASNSLVLQTANGPVYEIPVVIHVIHTGGNVGTNYNPGDAQLIGMVNYMNQVYQATYGGSYPDTNNGGTYFPVRFVLAKRDTACNPTTGIVRVNGSSVPNYTALGINVNNTNGASEINVKNLSRWPRNEYYNIWIVNRLDGVDGYPGTFGSFTAGYAYFPGGSAATDGTVMLASQAMAGASTLVHELGHAFGLDHTFRTGTETACPTVALGCMLDNDGVCDTQPIRNQLSVFPCPGNTDINPCTNTAYDGTQYNIMGYGYCPNRFTPGQRAKFLQNLSANRPGLISSLGSVPPGGTPVAATCTPPTTLANPSTSTNGGPYTVTFANMVSATAGYNGDAGRAYLNRTCIQRADVVTGMSYPLSVLTIGSIQKVAVYIDYNNNGTFDLPAEQVYTHTGTSTVETHSTSITIPTTATTCALLRMRVVSDASTATTITPCGTLTAGQAEDFSVYIKGTPAVATIAPAPGSSNPSCSGTSVSFTATISGGTNPTFVWYRNNQPVNVTGPTYTSATFVNGDAIKVLMYYTSPCGLDSVFSNPYIVNRQSSVAPTVSVAVTGGSNPGCPGQTLIFTATGSNTGTAPTYQWLVNGTAQGTAGTSNTYSSATLTNGSLVSVFMTSNSACATPATATATPVAVTFGTVTPDITIALTAGSNPVCAGKPVTFTATPVNGGTTPAYQWLVNGVVVAGATANTFTSSALANNSVVRCAFVSNNPCVTQPNDTSNAITLTVQPTVTSSALYTITQGSNPGCRDSVLEFTAATTNLGTNPAISWFVNGVLTASGPVYTTTLLQTGDVVTARAIASTTDCRTADTINMPSTTITRNVPGAAPVISFIGGNLVANLTTVQWYGTNGIIAGATNQSYHPTVAGIYFARNITGGCGSAPSNQLQISLLDVTRIDLKGVKVYPNPTSGKLTIDWSMQTSNATVEVFSAVGQRLMKDNMQRQSVKTLDLSLLARGAYFLVIRDENGSTGTIPVTVSK